MDSGQEQERLIIENLPEGFARLRLVSDTDNNTIDLIFLEVNRVFEKMTGQTRKDLLGQPLTKIMPGIENSEFDWIGVFNNVAGSVDGLSFEQYFEPLDRWFNINLFSDQPGIINILFHDITAQKEEVTSVKNLLDFSKRLVATDRSSFDFREPVKVMKRLSGARYVAINAYEKDHSKAVTRALAGISPGIRRAAEILGFDPEGQVWEINPDRLRAIEGGKLVRFNNLYDISMGAISRATASVIQSVVGVGDIYVIELAYGDRPAFGDIIFFMPKNRSLKNREAIELYAAQLGSFLTRLDAEEEAQKSRDQYESLVENIPGISYRRKLDHYWTMLYVSSDIESITGYLAADFIENRVRSYESIIHCEDSKRVYKQIKAAIGKNKPCSIEYRIIHRDGSVRWVYEKARGVAGSTGEVEYLDGFILDITDRKKMENDLNRTVNYVNSILDSIPDIVLRCDREGTFLDLISAPEGKKLFMPPDQFLGQKAEKVLPSEVSSLFRDTIKKTLATGQLTAISYELPVSEGNLHFNARFSRLNDNEVIVLIEEVTRRKKAEEALNYRLEFETMVAELSSYFVSLTPERLDEGINYALKRSAEFFGADRSYLFQFSEDLATMTNTQEWCAEGITSELGKNQEIPLDSLPWWSDMIKNREYVYISDTDALPPEAEAAKRLFQDRGIKTLLYMPLMRDGKLFGFFGFDAVKERKTWPQEQINLLAVIAEVITNALIRNLNDETIRYLSFHDQLTGLYNRHFFVTEIKRLEGSREYPVAVISADLDGLKLINDTMGHEKGDSYLRAGVNLLKNNLRSCDLLARVGGDEFAILLPRTDYAAAEKVVNRIYEQAEDYKDEQTVMPLSISLGMAVSESPEKPLEEAYQDADACMYKEKFSRSRNTRKEIIRAMLAKLHERDQTYSRENERLQAFSIELGQAAGLNEKQMADLVMLARVHELGLVTVPKEILNKHGQLNESELERIRQHPEKGYRIALNSPEMSEVAELILYHRENYDGSGYPRGLKGEEIPLECRILSIAKAFVELTEKSPHRPALGYQEVLSIIKEQAGTRFDPALTEIFSRNIEERLQS
ncbi:MAG: diguanylate cyclase [Bacillota bacterium]